LRTPKHLRTKQDYLTTDMLQWRLQYRYITRWITTNGKVEEGVLLEDSHFSAGYGLVLLCVFGAPSTDVQHLLLYSQEEPSQEPSITYIYTSLSSARPYS
jgi:hypothetical protein